MYTHVAEVQKKPLPVLAEMYIRLLSPALQLDYHDLMFNIRGTSCNMKYKPNIGS